MAETLSLGPGDETVTITLRRRSRWADVALVAAVLGGVVLFGLFAALCAP